MILGEGELVAFGGKWGVDWGTVDIGVKCLVRSGVSHRGDGGSAWMEQPVELGGGRDLISEDLPLLGLVSWGRGPRHFG